jgi:hypothetical protein
VAKRHFDNDLVVQSTQRLISTWSQNSDRIGAYHMDSKPLPGCLLEIKKSAQDSFQAVYELLDAQLKVEMMLFMTIECRECCIESRNSIKVEG